MEFGEELKDTVMVILRRFWFVVLCVFIFAGAAYPIARAHYKEDMDFYHVTMEEQQQIEKLNSVETVLLLADGLGDYDEEVASRLHQLTTYMKEYGQASELMEKVNSQLEKPVTYSQLQNMYAFWNNAGNSSIGAQVLANSGDAAKILMDTLLDEINSAAPAILGGEVTLTAVNRNSYEKADLGEQSVTTADRPPSMLQEYLSVVKLFAVCGFAIALLVIIIWNGISPVLGGKGKIEAKYGIKPYGPLKVK